jgi:hypothetical protein
MRRFALIALLTASLAASAVSVSAQDETLTFPITGSIDSTDDQFAPPLITTPNCTVRDDTPVFYELIGVEISQSANYTISLEDFGAVSAYYLFTQNLDLSDPLPSCIAANRDVDTLNVTIDLTPGLYFIAVIDNSFDDAGVPSYALDVFFTPATPETPRTRPARARAGDQCRFPLPRTAVIRSIPAGAPAFFAANLSTQINLTIPAGNWYVTETRGEFSRLWIACQAQPVWVPTNAIAP